MVLVLVVEVVWGWYISQFCFCLLLDRIILAFWYFYLQFINMCFGCTSIGDVVSIFGCCKETLHLCLNR